MMEGIGYVRVGFSEEPFPAYVLFLVSGWLKGEETLSNIFDIKNAQQPFVSPIRN